LQRLPSNPLRLIKRIEHGSEDWTEVERRRAKRLHSEATDMQTGRQGGWTASVGYLLFLAM